MRVEGDCEAGAVGSKARDGSRNGERDLKGENDWCVCVGGV